MVADAGCFADRQEGDGHEERGDVVGPQQPLVHMRQVVQEGQQGRQQRHGLRFSVQSLKENLMETVMNPLRTTPCGNYNVSARPNNCPGMDDGVEAEEEAEVNEDEPSYSDDYWLLGEALCRKHRPPEMELELFYRNYRNSCDINN